MLTETRAKMRSLLGFVIFAILFAGSAAQAQDDLERAILAGSWAYFWSEGEVGSRSAYFFHLDSVHSELDAEGQRTIAALGNQSLTSDAAYHLLEQQYQVMRVVRVSEAAGQPKWTDMTLNVNCPLGQIRLAQTVKGFAGRPAETSRSDQWFQVPMSWAYKATSLACQQKQWRDGWNFTAKYWICKRFRSESQNAISVQCSDAIKRSLIGYLCDLERSNKAGIVCASLGSEIEDIYNNATRVILPMLNGKPIADSDKAPANEPFVGVRPELPEEQ